MLNLLGEFHCKVDAKGRVLFPARLRKQLEAVLERGLVVNRDIFEGCLVIYPQPEWDKVNEEMARLSRYNAKHQLFQRKFMNGASALELDNAGRIHLPASLMQHAGIDVKDANELVIAGLTIPSTGSLPTSSGVTQPVQDRAGRLQLILAPGTYAFKSFGRSKSADVSLRTLLSFDTDRDGVTDLAEGCMSDLDANGSVDFGDLALLLLDMDTAGGPADLDASGVVDLADMALLLQDVGPCPTAP